MPNLLRSLETQHALTSCGVIEFEIGVHFNMYGGLHIKVDAGCKLNDATAMSVRWIAVA